MKRNVAGWLVLGCVVCGGLPIARAAEGGGQSAKPQATATSATTATAPVPAPATPPVPPMSPAPAAAPQAAMSSPLEGTTWPVKVTPDAMAAQKGEKPFDDSLRFKDGKVAMSACVQMGFAPSTYTALPVGGSWSFTTRQMSPGQGTTRWMATFTGATVKGTMTWMKQDGTILHYTVEGKKATMPGAS